MAFVLAIGYDRVDGVTLLPVQPTGTPGSGSTLGTPTPTDYLFIFGNAEQNQLIEELTDSPEIERAEQATFSHTFRTTWENCVALSYMIGRGVFVTDSQNNIWRILSAKIQHARGKFGTLSIVAESISFDSPPDEYQITPVELGIDIIKHPRYFWALNPSTENPVDNTDDYHTIANPGDPAPNQITVAEAKAAIIRAIQTYRDSPWQPGANNLNGNVGTNVVHAINTIQLIVGVNGISANCEDNEVCQFAAAAAGEIITKLWKNLDTPYLPGWQITWSQYFFAPVFLNPGAYIESPVGFVPDYFLSPSQDGTDTIFDQMAAINPQAFSVDGDQGGASQVSISWLRKSDAQTFQRTWFKVDMNWVGSPVGTWDKELFNAYGRPSQTPVSPDGITGFLPLPNS